jgi:hypothetical protein
VHVDFDAARRAYSKGQIDPVTFDLAGETFTCLCDPTLGDTFELADVPDLDPADFDSANRLHLATIRRLARYIRHMLPVDERGRWDQSLYRIPLSEMPVILEISEYITKAVTSRPTVPPTTSSRGRAANGRSSRKRPAGARGSR